MVHDDISQRADRIVEMAAVVDAEVLRQGDLDALHEVAIPNRLEHRVRETQEEDLFEPHLPEVVVDTVELRLVQVLVQLVRQRARRRKIVTERLLHDDSPRLRQANVGEPLHDGGEKKWRNLEIEHGTRRAFDRRAHLLVGDVVGEVALHVGKSRREPVKHHGVDLLTGSENRRARAFDELLDRPVVDRDTDDRTLEQPTLLKPIQRPEGHHFREIAGDAEHHQDIARRLRSVVARTFRHDTPSETQRVIHVDAHT